MFPADFLEFQVREIREAKLREGEDEELEEAFRRMSHAEDLVGICQEVLALTGEDTAAGCGNQISRAAKRIQDMTRYEPDSELPQQLSEVEALLSDFNQSLSAYMDEMTYDYKDGKNIVTIVKNF